MKTAMIQISEAGQDIADLLKRELGAKVIKRTDVSTQWKKFDAFIFIGAMGICVRTIAPYVKDKHEDPAVVCVDSLGLNADGHSIRLPNASTGPLPAMMT